MGAGAVVGKALLVMWTKVADSPTWLVSVHWDFFLIKETEKNEA